MKIDLHIHSNYSDGVLSVFQIIDEAVKNKVQIISITDHDSIKGYSKKLFDYAKGKNITLIPGVEISTKYQGFGVHILGYNIDLNNEKKEEERTIDYILEPSAEELMQEMLPKVLRMKMFTVLLDSNAAEHAARTMAMQIATDNANELLQELTVMYNKSRQQSITNELLDIVGGSMA